MQVLRLVLALLLTLCLTGFSIFASGCLFTALDSQNSENPLQTNEEQSSIDTLSCLEDCLSFCAQWCEGCTVCSCEEGSVVLDGTTCLSQCSAFCEDWYSVCQECEEETCSTCQEPSESEAGCPTGNCPLSTGKHNY